jgi:sterol desaturase/sphingolipid hydroxylase (fatty acid hydroxylase superfamily)
VLVPMLTVFAVVAALAFAIERIDPARPQPIFRRAFLMDCVYCVTSIAVRALVNGTVAIVLSNLGARLLPGYAVGVLREQPVWMQTVAIIVALDLIFYVLHRWKHGSPWLWRLHETHHSSEDLDWLSSVRFHPLEKVFDRTIYLFPLLFLGVSETALLILAAVDATIATFSHSNVNWRIGPLIYVFVGPEMHRWHHSSDPRHQHCNFGNNLSIFDWLFGTAFLSRDHPREFGLNDPSYPERSFPRQFLYAFRARERG